MSLRSALFLQEMGIAVQWQRKGMPGMLPEVQAPDGAEVNAQATAADVLATRDEALTPRHNTGAAIGSPDAFNRNDPVAPSAVPLASPPGTPLLAPRVLVKPRIAEKPAASRPPAGLSAGLSADASADFSAGADSIPWASDEMPVLSADDYMPDQVPEWADFPIDDAPSREELIAAMDWPQLQQAAASCTACSLCHQRKKSVFGRGNPAPLWLVVGDSPNAQDEAAATPVSGDAGTLLENMLQAVGRTKQVYVTNLVKCRAQDEQGQPRPPTAQEIAACRPFLQRQFALLQPRLTLALGKTAALALRVPGAQASALRGSVHQAFGKPMVATWHPAILLGQPLEKRQVWADLCLARGNDGNNGSSGAEGV